MIVLIQNVTQFAAFSTELSTVSAPFTFNLRKKEDEVVKSFDSTPVTTTEPLRITVFEWSIVDSQAQENISENRIFLTVGQWLYIVTDSTGAELSSGNIRVDGTRTTATEYEPQEDFIVYGQK